MNIELVVNTFWFSSIFTAAIYIIKKRYVGKKEYSIIDKACLLYTSDAADDC